MIFDLLYHGGTTEHLSKTPTLCVLYKLCARDSVRHHWTIHVFLVFIYLRVPMNEIMGVFVTLSVYIFLCPICGSNLWSICYFLFIPTKSDMDEVSGRFDNDLRIYPDQFVRTCAKYNSGQAAPFNRQTYDLVDKLDICDGLFGRPPKRDDGNDFFWIAEFMELVGISEISWISNRNCWIDKQKVHSLYFRKKILVFPLELTKFKFSKVWDKVNLFGSSQQRSSAVISRIQPSPACFQTQLLPVLWFYVSIINTALTGFF